MTTDTFDHLMSFAIAGAYVPTDRVQSLLATRAQLEMLGDVLRAEEPIAPPLAETREPDLSKVNYTEAVRGDVSGLWQPLVEDPASLPPAQLVERLDTTWKTAEKTIGEAVQQKAAQIFAERAQRKGQLLEGDAARLATAQGLPAAVRWLETLKTACTEARQLIGRGVAQYATRQKRQQETLGQLKEEWLALLSRDAEEMGEIARRFLLLAGGVLLAGIALWFLSIAATSVIGLATVAVFVLLALRTARPLFSHLRLSRQMTVTAAMLASAYRASSLYSLDELVARLEMSYPDALGQHLERLQRAYQQRIALADARWNELQTRRDTLRATLLDAPPTMRPLLRDEGIEEWYRQGRVQVPMGAWVQRLASLQQEPGWEAMAQEALQAFAFLREVRAETELYRLYENQEERMAFLQSLREAAIGPIPGEAFLALDFAVNGGKPPQVHLLIEVDDPQTSSLGQELKAAWSDAGIGVTIDRASDPTTITLIGLVYGYALGAQKGWENIEAAFESVKKVEGQGIYPVLPQNGDRREMA